MAENPARIFGLYGQKGVVAPGADADFTILDMNQSRTVHREDLLSKNPITLYDGVELRGVPVASFLRGRQIMADGVPLGEPGGQVVRPGAPSQAFW
jgi:dihydroorotase-like cyclic amidohydrolase